MRVRTDMRIIAAPASAVFIAVFACAAAAPAPAQTERGERVEQLLNEIAKEMREANDQGQLVAWCEEGLENRRSDLCAQWRAADNAGSAARAAWVFGTIGSIIGLLTLLAAGAAALYARAAARAAHHANRAWLVIKNLKVSHMANLTFDDGGPTGIRVECTYDVENVGRSPALCVAFVEQVAFSFEPVQWMDQTSKVTGFSAIAPQQSVKNPPGKLLFAKLPQVDPVFGGEPLTAGVQLAITINYRSAHDGKARQTAAIFAIGQTDVQGHRSALKILNLAQLDHPLPPLAAEPAAAMRMT